jgi:Ca2+-binding EF-hand superfamily protein
VEFVWTKVMERHRTSAAAFRSFDAKGKGKLRKSQFVEGFERLRIRLSAEDIDKIWDILDS